MDIITIYGLISFRLIQCFTAPPLQTNAHKARHHAIHRLLEHFQPGTLGHGFQLARPPGVVTMCVGGARDLTLKFGNGCGVGGAELGNLRAVDVLLFLQTRDLSVLLLITSPLRLKFRVFALEKDASLGFRKALIGL